MRILFIGGTGLISSAATRRAVAEGHDVTLLTRGRLASHVPGAAQLRADIGDPSALGCLRGEHYDAVVDWVAFTPADIERDLELFRGRTGQYVFISSASAYQKPPTNYLITEATPLSNPFWRYSRDKIECERRLLSAYRDEAFPATIVRPSMTYDTNLPVASGAWDSFNLPSRMLAGKPIVVHGDGTSLWVATHADDLARGLLGLLGNERALGEAFHITSDEVSTWNRIYQTIAEELGVEAHLVHVPSDLIVDVVPERAGSLLGDKTWSVVFDNTKIKEFVPEFHAEVALRDGVRRALEWFAADESRRRVDPVADEQEERILRRFARTAE